MTKPNTSCTIEVPASLRSENCSPSARNAVRVPSGISVRLRRNPQQNGMVVQDVFGRILNQRGITMVDWDGYVANPAIKLFMVPPAAGLEPRDMSHCIEINRLEEAADQLGRNAVADLFQNEKDPIRIMKLKEIYEFLEQTTDYC